MAVLETDYLVVGAGAAGMAFTDALIADSEADVVMVDRRHAPGGHWHDAYPFVRLHQPSAYYGTNSLPLGSETIDQHGANEGFYERASAAEICAYFDRVMQQQLLPSGRVRYFPMCEFIGDNRFASRLTTEQFEVRVRKKLVDARYLEPAVPATSRAPFDVADGVRCVAVGELTRLADHADGFTVIGAGKTAIDACLWLLDSGVPPDDICWIKPREAWLLNRAFAQGGELVATLFEGLSLQVEAAAQARSITDLFGRLEAAAQLMRIDEHVSPTSYRGATMSARELEQLRSIRKVVRLGYVRRIERDSIVLDRGTVATRAGTLHLHCAARGLNPAPEVPMFSDARITLQPIRTGLIPFNAALVGFVEATQQSTARKNELCPPNRLPDSLADWARGARIGINADYLWSRDPALSSWLERARLNPMRGLRRFMAEPGVQRALKRYTDSVRPALDNLLKFAAEHH
jgi:hypothetical protein